MLKLHHLSICCVFIGIFSLTGCAQQKPVCPKPNHDFLSDPNANGVAYFVNKNGKHCIYPRNVKLNPVLTDRRYHMIGTISVNSHNESGLKRQQATIDDMLREKAAARGGNAITDIRTKGLKTYGKVILMMG